MSTPVTEGFLEFAVPNAGKTCQTWYKIFGELKPGSRPLVTLPGGPGLSSDYLHNLSDITTPQSRALVVYDQLGNGRSTHLPEKRGDTTFWTEQLFLGELDNLLTKLNIAGNYDLLGHSWGGMLASRHASLQPSGLRHLVLVSSPPDVKLWMKATTALKALLPRDVQALIDKHEEEGTAESEEYQTTVQAFFARHVCRLNPLPQEMIESLEWSKKDPTVYFTLNGPSVFHITGPLKDWSIMNDAHRVVVPTLLINGGHDAATDEVIAPYFKFIPHVKWVTFVESSHMSHLEERERYMRVVGDFLLD